MKHLYLIPFAAFILANSSCKKDDEDEETIGNKLKAEDLAAPEATSSLAGLDISDFLEGAKTDFLATESAALSSSAEGDCLLGSLFNLPVSAKDDTLTLDVALDFSTCVQKSFGSIFPGATVDVRKAFIGFYNLATCDGQDLSSFDGTKLKDLPDRGPCEGSGKLLTNSRINLDLSVTLDGQTFTLTNTSYTATATLANEPCTYSGTAEARTVSNDCVSVSKTITSSPEASTEYSKFSYKDLTWADSEANTWYSQGSMDLLINNWTGSIVFTGPLENPTYNLSNGVDTLTGTLFMPPPVTTLAPPLYRPAMLKLIEAIQKGNTARKPGE